MTNHVLPKAHILHKDDGTPEAGHLAGTYKGKNHKIPLKFVPVTGEGGGHRIVSRNEQGREVTLGHHVIKDGHHELTIRGNKSRTKVDNKKRFVLHQFGEQTSFKTRVTNLFLESLISEV